MNLVIDDAVEVRQATKSEEEKRRSLGRHMRKAYATLLNQILTMLRPNTTQRRQCLTDSGFAIACGREDDMLPNAAEHFARVGTWCNSSLGQSQIA